MFEKLKSNINKSANILRELEGYDNFLNEIKKSIDLDRDRVILSLENFLQGNYDITDSTFRTEESLFILVGSKNKLLDELKPLLTFSSNDRLPLSIPDIIMSSIVFMTILTDLYNDGCLNKDILRDVRMLIKNVNKRYIKYMKSHPVNIINDDENNECIITVNIIMELFMDGNDLFKEILPFNHRVYTASYLARIINFKDIDMRNIEIPENDDRELMLMEMEKYPIGHIIDFINCTLERDNGSSIIYQVIYDKVSSYYSEKRKNDNSIAISINPIQYKPNHKQYSKLNEMFAVYALNEEGLDNQMLEKFSINDINEISLDSIDSIDDLFPKGIETGFVEYLLYNLNDSLKKDLLSQIMVFKRPSTSKFSNHSEVVTIDRKYDVLIDTIIKGIGENPNLVEYFKIIDDFKGEVVDVPSSINIIHSIRHRNSQQFIESINREIKSGTAYSNTDNYIGIILDIYYISDEESSKFIRDNLSIMDNAFSEFDNDSLLLKYMTHFIERSMNNDEKSSVYDIPNIELMEKLLPKTFREYNIIFMEHKL